MASLFLLFLQALDLATKARKTVYRNDPVLVPRLVLALCARSSTARQAESTAAALDHESYGRAAFLCDGRRRLALCGAEAEADAILVTQAADLVRAMRSVNACTQSGQSRLNIGAIKYLSIA